MAERTPAVGDNHTAPMPQARVALSSTRGSTASAGKQSPRSKDGKVHTASDSGDPLTNNTAE